MCSERSRGLLSLGLDHFGWSTPLRAHEMRTNFPATIRGMAPRSSLKTMVFFGAVLVVVAFALWANKEQRARKGGGATSASAAGAESAAP